MLQVLISSFSFKKSTAKDEEILLHYQNHGGGFVFDCRLLPNPGREARFKTLTGRDEETIKFLASSLEVRDFLELVMALATRSVKNYLERGFDSILFEFGCTGGQHRSVYCAEALGIFLRKSFDESSVAIKVMHRECKP